MNLNDERLLKYFENEMSRQERKEFENELQANPDLLIKLNEFKRVSSSFSVYKNVEADERYFNSLIPRFNEKDKRSKVSLFADYLLRPVYLYSVLSSAAAVMIIFFTLISVNKTEPVSIQSLANEMQETEITEQLETYKEDYYTAETIQESVSDSTVSNYYYDQIKENPDQIAEYISSNSGYEVSYSSIYKDLSDEEADKIYNELINKEIL